ncbi:MAG: hypothetical protein AAGI49_08695 [Bacteroidota bacterium]
MCISRFLLLALGLWLYGSTAHAQVPGYLGKRTFFTFDIAAAAAIGAPTKGNAGTDAGNDLFIYGVGLNYEWQAQISHVISRDKAIGLRLGHYTTATDSYASFATSGEELFPTDYTGPIQSDDVFFLPRVQSLGLVYMKFNQSKGAIAPMGSYKFFGLKRAFISNTGAIVDEQGEGSSSSGDDISIDDRFGMNFFIMGASKTRIFADKMLFNVGFQVGLPLSFKYLQDDFSFSDEFTKNTTRFRNSVGHRIVGHELFRMNIGVGLLLF